MTVRRIQRQVLVAAIGVLAASAWVASSPAHAQTTNGSIYGTVTDSTGAVIPNASVTAKNEQNGFADTKHSNASGEYVFPVLAPGNYVVSAQASGFKSMTQTGIVLNANQNVHVIFNMPVGTKNDVVTVTSDTTLVDTRGYTVSTTIDQSRIEELPLSGGTGDAYDLVQTVPGVTHFAESQTAGNAIGDDVGVQFSSNGQRGFANAYYLDGADNRAVFRPGGNYPPNANALQEIRVLSSNFDTEFGDMPGAVVNMITRSGTSQYHGSAYDFVRNNIFNAKTEFVATAAVHFRQNQFGGNIGGPMPFLHKKLLGFFSYQGLRIAQFGSINLGTGILPTGPAGSGTGQTAGASPGGERNGDFSTDKVIPKCTGTSAANTTTYPCGGPVGVIPKQFLDPVVQNLLTFFPVPATYNGTSGGASPAEVAPELTTSDEFLGRGDYDFKEKHRISYMFFHYYGSTPNPIAGQPFIGYAGNITKDAVTNNILTETWTISPNKVNTFRAYYTANRYVAADSFNDMPSRATLGIAIPCAAQPCNQPVIRATGYFNNGIGNGNTAPNFFYQTTAGGGDTFYWTHANHTLKFGATVLRRIYDSEAVGQRAGIYTPTGGASGNLLADFLMGKSATFTQQNSLDVDTYNWSRAGFAQDDWNSTHRLTLSLGIRWEVFPPLAGMRNTGNFVPNMQSLVEPTAPTGLLFLGDPGIHDGVKVTAYDRFAPRVGFAYDVFGNGKMAVRGGFGVFYMNSYAGLFAGLSSPIYAENISLSSTTNYSNPYAGLGTSWTAGSGTADPFPYTPNLANPTFAPGLSFTALPANDSIDPYVYEWNLAVEHQFAPDWAATISYVANSSFHLYTVRDENSPVYSQTCTAATCNTAASILARRPYKPTTTSYVFNSIGEYYPESSANYNSLQLKLTKRFSHNFSINASYVWSKDLTNGQDTTPSNVSLLTATNEYDLSQDYGKAVYDQPQAFVASYLWESPNIHRWGYLGKELLSDWSFNGITTLATGLPVNILSGATTAFDNSAAIDRPDQIADWHLPGNRSRAAKIGEYFNTAAFAELPCQISSTAVCGSANPTGNGNAQYDLVVGPGKVVTDLAASKSLTVWNENKLQFRCDAYNLFNHVNLGSPGATLNAATFGKITAAGTSGRILQLAMKYSF